MLPFLSGKNHIIRAYLNNTIEEIVLVEIEKMMD